MNYKILIVEDEEIQRFALCEILNNLKCQVFSASCGNDGIKILKENHDINMVISDLTMANGRGEEIFKYLNEVGYSCTRIVISVLCTFEKKSELYNLGIVDYITKPFDFRIISKKLSNYIEDDGDFYGEELIFIDISKNRLFILGEIISLTEQERIYLESMIAYPGKVFSTDELINSWNDNNQIKQVKVIIFNLRKKLGNYANIIKNKKGVGYYYDEKELNLLYGKNIKK